MATGAAVAVVVAAVAIADTFAAFPYGKHKHILSTSLISVYGCEPERYCGYAKCVVMCLLFFIFFFMLSLSSIISDSV